jgi:formylglycine-generating enzyme required for sulfatase activity
VDANNIQTENHLRQRAVSVQTVLDNLNDAGNALNVVVLDACRDNPFGWARSGSRGLSVVSRAPVDSIIVYATSAGSVASDGTGRNGLFTTHLLNNLKVSGLEVQEMFRRTMGDVARASDNQQHPEYRSQFYDIAYLGTNPVSDGFVRINGGTFTMGSSANEWGRNPNDETQWQVTVNSFRMGRYQVTQAEYESMMGNNPSHFKGKNLPVEMISWFDAVEYCNRRSQREGLTPAYTINGTGDNRTVTWNRNANGYRLPTEAEWEYACRAGTTTAYNTGASLSDNTGWYTVNSAGSTQEVGKKPPNAWGLHDMHGNVWEWCWDWYGTYTSGTQTDPTGPSFGYYRVLRGGSWNVSGGSMRSAYRYYGNPSYWDVNGGFRLVRP